MTKFKYQFTEEQVKILDYALKQYASLHRSMSKEIKPIREKIHSLTFNADESYTIQAALDSTFCFIDTDAETIEGHRIRLKFYEQWYSQDKGMPKNWRTPKAMIKQDFGLINEKLQSNNLKKVKY